MPFQLSFPTSHQLHVLGWTLLHSVWQGFAVALLLAAVLHSLRRGSAQVRYATSCGALLALPALPLATFWVLYCWEPTPVPKVSRYRLGEWVTDREKASLDRVVVETEENLELRIDALARGVGVDLELITPWLAGLWLVGLAAISLWRTGGWGYLQYLRWRSTQEVEPVWQEKVATLSRCLHLRRAARILVSRRLEIPVTLGWLKPVILLPVGMLSGLPAAQVEAILLHELSHIRRYDYVVNLVQTLVESLLFYHPGVWWVSRRLREERECCCDAEAVRACGDVVRYSRALLALEEWRSAVPRLALAAGGGSLQGRIKRLVEGRAVPGCVPSWQMGMAAGPFLAALFLLVGLPGRGVGGSALSGRIAFTAAWEGNWEIYAMDASGAGQTRLTNDRAYNAAPNWSPDGRRIAFQRGWGGSEEIYLMDADGSRMRRLTWNRVPDLRPVWSPDGERLAFVSLRDGNEELYVMNGDGSGVRRLTYAAGEDMEPAWSPDGTRIAFCSTRDGNQELYAMAADGTGVVRLTHHPAVDSSPQWSADSRGLLFQSDRSGNLELYVMNADGTGLRRLSLPRGEWSAFSWLSIPRMVLTAAGNSP